MPSKKTTNYQLSQWEPDDKVLRTDFNADNLAIDTALKDLNTSLSGKASSSSLTSLQSTVSQLQSALSTMETTVAKKQDASAAVKLAASSYTGNGQASRTITLGWRPKAVYICESDGRTYYPVGSFNYVRGGLAVDGSPLSIDGVTCAEVTASGFKVYHNDSVSPGKPWLNRADTVYHYVAIA